MSVQDLHFSSAHTLKVQPVHMGDDTMSDDDDGCGWCKVLALRQASAEASTPKWAPQPAGYSRVLAGAPLDSIRPAKRALQANPMPCKEPRVDRS
eukprot:1736765-Pleurochrysis_carterae.AAC.3